ncbi:Imm42 family immunity protein [Chryseobacterium sp.]|uniref:Imm42 family immunity protein n=1 Tax=Chryseobacterium sp. TaxID=1871047 RepID=UPI00388DA14B
MLIKHHDDFFVQWETVFVVNDHLNLGIFNFWIDDKAYPAAGINITLNSLFYELVSEIPMIENLELNIGNLPIDEIDFGNYDNNNLVWINSGELYQYGFALVIGFDGNRERIFFTKDYEKTYEEIVLPKGTFLQILKDLSQHSFMKNS